MPSARARCWKSSASTWCAAIRRRPAVVHPWGLIMTALAMHAIPRRPPQQWACDPGCGFAVQTSAASLMRDGTVEALEIIPYGYEAYCRR